MQFVRVGFLALGISLLAAATPANKPAPAAHKPHSSPAAKPALPVQAAPPAAPPAAAEGPQTIAFADGVRALFDENYETIGGFRPLTLDLYLPQPRNSPVPFVVFVHGGGWSSGDARHAGTFTNFPATLASVAAEGYVVASVNYRLSGEARFPAALEDVKAAIRWLRAHAADYNIDTTRGAVWGEAAGGELAAMVGVTCGVAKFEPKADGGGAPSDCVHAVIDWYGVTDLETLATDNGMKTKAPTAEGDYLGCEPASCAPMQARNASPLAFISAMSPAFLIQHGALDTEVSPKQSQKLYDALTTAGVPAELILYPDVAHGFARNGTADDAVNKQAIVKLETFLAATFPYAPMVKSADEPRQRGPLY